MGARMIRDGDCDFALAGGVDTCRSCRRSSTASPT
ncbi:MAG: hypothetical protein MZV70_67645 [Desulfobacterales bacterium]|nr:hypothetical protein [Desulfobacterales bacterium]